MSKLGQILGTVAAVMLGSALAGCMNRPPNPYDKAPTATGASSIGSTLPSIPAHTGPTGTVSGGSVNADESHGLSEYLKHHSLPLVSAQVVDSSPGARQVILSGFVATDFGKSDAEAKARKYLNDSSVLVDNRIRVSPELADAIRKSATAADSHAPSQTNPYPIDPSVGSAQDYENQVGPGGFGGGSYSSSTGIGIGSGGGVSSMSALAILLPSLFGALAMPSSPYGYGGYPHSGYGTAPSPYGYGSGYPPAYPPYGSSGGSPYGP
jgi:hypothetical protein